MSAWLLLPLLREPEYISREPWELQWLLFSLRYTDKLEPEEEIAAAAAVAREDQPEWRPAA